MSVAMGDLQTEILKAVAHPVRKGIILSLVRGQRTFSDLMLDCALDPGSETGLFLYHLSKLIEGGFVEKKHGKYWSTEKGEDAFRLLGSLPSPHIYPQAEEGGGKMARDEATLPKIIVETAKVSNMTISGLEFEPGEVRVYEESRRIHSRDFDGGSFYVEECIGSKPLRDGRITQRSIAVEKDSI